jgi:hypothetical protein
MLSIVGGVLGVLLAPGFSADSATWVGRRLPIPLLSQVAIDPSVLAFAAIVHGADDAHLRARAGDRRHRRFARDRASRRRAEAVGIAPRPLIRQSFVMAEIASR